MNVIARFAPSPTGYLHLGGVRTALFNYLFAKHYNGKFLLRIEDTDDARLVESSLNSIVSGLEWLGIKCDGDIILQSENRLRHQAVAKELIDAGNAYYCYCTQEELSEERKKAGFGYKYSGKCKHRKDIPEGIKPTVRLNSESFDVIEFHDLISGDASYGRDNLDDFIILRSDGVPTYMFAVVVDDNDAGVTHVIRGNDHHTNTAKQLMVYKLMGWKEPEYAHLPLINSDDGTKMSKRKHAVDILDYKHDGFLAPALVNYLMHLGWTGSKEIMSLDEAIEKFGIGGLHHSPACFDMKKLQHINSHYLKELADHSHTTLMRLIDENYNYSHYHHLPKDVAHSIEKSLNEVVKRSSTLKEIIQNSFFYFDDWKEKISGSEENGVFIRELIGKLSDSVKEVSSPATTTTPLSSPVSFSEGRGSFSNIRNDLINDSLPLEQVKAGNDKFLLGNDNQYKKFQNNIRLAFEDLLIDNWNYDCIESIIKNICEQYKTLKKSDVMKFLRVVLTGTLHSYSIVKIIEILGKKRVVDRLMLN
jgi:glutamyl-tRNA synthetase